MFTVRRVSWLRRLSGWSRNPARYQARLGLESLENRDLLTAPAGIVVAPHFGTPGSTQTVTVMGQNLEATSTVQFQPVAGGTATPVTTAISLTNSNLTFQQPTSLALGSYYVIVSNGSDSSGECPVAEGQQAPCGFTVQSQVPPNVTSVTAFGTPGSTVTVNGSSFTGATSVQFVNRTTSTTTPGTGLKVVSDSQLTIVAPATLPLGTYDVTVTNPAGTSPISQATDSFVAVAPAVVGVTHFTNASAGQAINQLTGGVLNVVATYDFTPTGSLFVQTENGVATVAYTGITATSFTGCTVTANDPFKVGATDTTGVLDITYPAVYQATNETYEFTFTNDTKLTSTTTPTANLYMGMFWSSAVPSGVAASFYYLNVSATNNACTGCYSYAPVSNVGAGNDIPTTLLSTASGDKITVKVPYMPTNSARFVFGVGSAPTLEVVANTSGDLGVSTPVPNTTTSYYDYVEFTLDANAADPTVPNALRFLPDLNINTTQVDQFGFPITLTGLNNDNGVNKLASVGVTLSTTVARDAIFTQYNTDFPSASSPYAQLVLPNASSSTQPYRILNPGKVTIATTNSLGNVFDSSLHTLFESGTLNLSLVSGYNGQTYTSTRTSVMATGSDGKQHSYDVLAFSGPSIPTVYIYEPFFSTNAPSGTNMPNPNYYTGKPPAMKWLAPANETAGQMVFGNDGVFSDSGLQIDPTTGEVLTKDQAGVLADLENQVVAALNRGIANTYNTTAEWQNSLNYYTGSDASNEYAKFLHKGTISNTPIFIDGKAYAIAYDDQGGQNPTLVLVNQDQIGVTLGSWTASGGLGAPAQDSNEDYVRDLYSTVLGRAPDAGGLTYWTGLLTSGTSHTDIAKGIRNSPEGRAFAIEALYSKLLHRSSDAQGMVFFLNAAAAGWTEDQMKAIFYGSSEYFKTRAGETNDGFLAALYQDELGRAIDSQGQRVFGQSLLNGVDRQTVALVVVRSIEADQVLVKGYYATDLHRPADADGLAYWVALLQQGQLESDINSGILGSDEYFRN